MADKKEKNSFSTCMFAGGIEQEMVFPYPCLDTEEGENLKLIAGIGLFEVTIPEELLSVARPPFI